MIDKLLRQLEREIGCLPQTDGRKIARRNARKRVLGTLRKIRAAVDKQWPALVDRAGQQRLTLKGRARRAEQAGLEHVSEGQAGRMAGAGVRIRHINGGLWAPQWALTIDSYRASKLAAAVKDRKLRNTLLAEHALLA